MIVLSLYPNRIHVMFPIVTAMRKLNRQKVTRYYYFMSQRHGQSREFKKSHQKLTDVIFFFSTSNMCNGKSVPRPDTTEKDTIRMDYY